jgi:hypothetical protein
MMASTSFHAPESSRIPAFTQHIAAIISNAAVGSPTLRCTATAGGVSDSDAGRIDAYFPHAHGVSVLLMQLQSLQVSWFIYFLCRPQSLSRLWVSLIR